jgi:hypothetical protein
MTITPEIEKKLKAEVDAFLERTNACRKDMMLTKLELYHAARIGYRMGQAALAAKGE